MGTISYQQDDPSRTCTILDCIPVLEMEIQSWKVDPPSLIRAFSKWPVADLTVALGT
jgi:hypothetical protein